MCRVEIVSSLLSGYLSENKAPTLQGITPTVALLRDKSIKRSRLYIARGGREVFSWLEVYTIDEVAHGLSEAIALITSTWAKIPVYIHARYSVLITTIQQYCSRRKYWEHAAAAAPAMPVSSYCARAFLDYSMGPPATNT